MLILCVILMSVVTAAMVGLLASAIIGSDDTLHASQAQRAEAAALPSAACDVDLRQAA
ncbi:MAG: hypothetical protein ACRDMJ_04035 [Solirubrobacteraceae bacterium]